MDAVPRRQVFVANLSPTCTEDELRDLFARTPGFLKMRFSPGKPGGANVSPVAWVDFTDTHMSSQALNTLQVRRCCDTRHWPSLRVPSKATGAFRAS